jgi:hypothetical protein
VNKATAVTALASAPNPSSLGQVVTFTATVTSSTGVSPSGTVSFNEGSVTLANITLDITGTATFATATLSTGKHNIKAVFGATPEFARSTSTGVAQVVR